MTIGLTPFKKNTLSFVLCGMILLFGSTLTHAYDYPDLSPLAATVVGTPLNLKAKVPRDIPIEEMELTVHPERTVPDVLWYDETLRYSFVPQDGPAPFLFMIAGTGAAYNSPKMMMLQRAFYQAGFHVLCLSSPTHPSFIAAASTTGIPGHLLDDSRDLYNVMSLAWLQLQLDDIEVTDFYVTGYSLGAAQAAFVSHLDENRQVFNFRKVLMINPPVNLYTSALILDEMLHENIPGGLNNFQPFFDEVFQAFSEEYRQGDFVNFSGDFLYAAYQRRQPPDSKFAALIGLSFRLSAANMIFTSDVFTNSGYIKPKHLVLSPSDSVTDYFKVTGRISFENYFEELFAPYFQRRYPSLTKAALIESLGLKGIEDYLRQSRKIGLVHNTDDVILGSGDLGYFQHVFGARAKIFPRGGHCGNIDHKDVVAFMIDFFREATASHPGHFDPEEAADAEMSLPEVPANILLVSNRPAIGFPLHHSILNRSNPDARRERPVTSSSTRPSNPSVQSTFGGLDTSSDEFSRNDGLLVQSDSRGSSGNALRQVSDIVRDDVQYPIDVYDPFEGFNRRMYKFNAQFDESVFLPVVRGYEIVTPDYVEDRISSFFQNVAEIRNLLNAALQLKGAAALTTSARFLINTTLGIGGLWDHATGWGLHQQTEDFGETLGHYGVTPGSYLVLPFLGPSNLRDTTGLAVDYTARYLYATLPLDLDDNPEVTIPASFLNIIDRRA